MTPTEYHTLFFDRHLQPMWIYDRATLAFLAVNEAAVRLYGYSQHEFMQLKVKDILPPEELHRFIQKTLVISDKGFFQEAGRWTHHKKDRNPIHVILTQQAMEWNGHPAVLVALHDITAQHQAEIALMRAEQRLSEIQGIAHVGSWEMDLTSSSNLPQYTVHWSEELYRIMGMEPRRIAMIANDYMTRVHPDDQEPSERAGRKAIEEGGHTDMRQRVFRADGVERIVHTRGKVICDTRGNPIRMVGTVTDITETEHAVQALSDTQEMYRQLLDAISDMVLLKGPQSKIRWANKTFRDFYGMTNEQLAGVIDSPISEPDFTERFVKDDAYVFETGRVLDIPKEPVKRHDGVIRYFHTIKSPIFNSRGDVVMTVGVARDITDREQLERIVSQSEKLSAVGQLAAGIAHEINNPLGVILGFAEAGLRHVSAGEPLQAPLESIRREARRCTELVQNLLKFSRQGKPGFALESPTEVLSNALVLVEAQAPIRHVRVETSIAASLPQIRIDRTEIQQVVINLCFNGMDAMPEGGVLRVDAALATGGIEIRVKDTGQGIPPEIADRIFDPFFTTKPVGKGTGLGLSLVFETIKKHNGRVTFETAVGQGTTFIVWLPLDPNSSS